MRKDVVAEASLLAWESDPRAIGGTPATSHGWLLCSVGVLARGVKPEDTSAPGFIDVLILTLLCFPTSSPWSPSIPAVP